MRVVSVARKLSTIEKPLRDRSCLFSARKLQQQKPQSFKSIPGLSLGESGVYGLGTVPDRTTKPRTEFFISARVFHKIILQTRNCPNFDSRINILI
jgi:hypothetical protein